MLNVRLRSKCEATGGYKSNMGDAPYPTPLIYLDVCNRHKGP